MDKLTDTVEPWYDRDTCLQSNTRSDATGMTQPWYAIKW